MFRIYIVAVHQSFGGNESLTHVITILDAAKTFVENFAPVPVNKLLLPEDNTELLSTLDDIQVCACIVCCQAS